MAPVLHEFRLAGSKGLAIYRYEQTIKERLYQLKGCADIEIAPVFLEYFLPYLRLRYLGYEIVPAPSYCETDRQRGFNHVEEIFKGLKMKMLHCIKKTSPLKQADLNRKDRASIARRLVYDGHVSLRGKKLLIVDDVMTTGSTLKAMIDLLRRHGAGKIQVLVMAYVSKET